MHTKWRCTQGLAHPSAASTCTLPTWSQPDSGGDRSWCSLYSGGFRGVFCTSATGRESHQGRPGCYCSEEEHRSQLHRAVDVCPCYLGGMLSSCSVSDASGSGTRIETSCLGSVSQLSPRSYVQLAERGRQHSHIASMLSSGCHLYRC